MKPAAMGPGVADNVNRLELWHVAVPLPKPFHPAWIPGYPQTENRFTLLRATTGRGRVGLAAGPAFATEREGLGVVVGPYLLGTAADREGMLAMHQRLRELSYLGWRNHWIEAAWQDLLGQEFGMPLWKLFAGQSGELSCYASSGERRSPEDTARLVRELARRGFAAVKVRVHAPTLEEDLAVLRAASEAAREAGVGLAVDANQGWPVSLIEPTVPWGFERAVKFARACAEQRVLWLEEPLDMHDLEGLARLRREGGAPIAGGELLGDWGEARRYLQQGAVDILQVDCVFAGLVAARPVIEEAAAKGVAYNPHAWTNGFGLLLNAHVLAAANAKQRPALLEYPLDPPGWVEEARDGVLKRGLVAENGKVRLPDAPGLGAELDERALQRHGTKFYEGTPGTVARQVVREKGLLTAVRLALKKRKR